MKTDPTSVVESSRDHATPSVGCTSHMLKNFFVSFDAASAIAKGISATIQLPERSGMKNNNDKIIYIIIIIITYLSVHVHLC